MHGQKDTTTATMKAGKKLLTPDMMKVGMTAKSYMDKQEDIRQDICIR